MIILANYLSFHDICSACVYCMCRGGERWTGWVSWAPTRFVSVCLCCTNTNRLKSDPVVGWRWRWRCRCEVKMQTPGVEEWELLSQQPPGFVLNAHHADIIYMPATLIMSEIPYLWCERCCTYFPITLRSSKNIMITRTRQCKAVCVRMGWNKRRKNCMCMKR